MSATVKLSKPIQAHDQQVTELVLREPTVEDVMELGYPFLVVPNDAEGSGVELRPKVVAKYVVRLAQVPMSTVKAMTLGDLSACQAVVMDFFGGGAGETPTPSLTAPST